MSLSVFRRLLLLTAVSPAATLVAQPASARDAQAELSLARIFSSAEFQQEYAPALRWLDDSTYTILSGEGAGVELQAINAATGAREVIATAAALTPSGARAPLSVEDYEFSSDRQLLLLFTNSARVWRANTRGDFWLLDRRRGTLRQLGGPGAAPQSLQFARFSPDGRRIAYVRDHNLYVETVAGAVTALTTDGSRTTINGTFDWVYEEELYMRDGFRWSPDGRRIAYWQLDASGVRDFLLINNTDSLYSFTVPVQYPKAGTTNSAARVGVVSADGGATTWFGLPGDPRQHYVARMDWAASNDELLIQQLDRRQQTRTFWMASAGSGAVRTVFVEHDSAWIDVWDDHQSWGPGPSVHWLGDGREFLVLSEIDGWRHLHAISRTGSRRLVTNGAYDAMQVLRVDAVRGWVYFVASPANGTQRHLWRTRLDGTGQAERITPSGVGGWHDYDISPRGSYAIHTGSAFGVPPVVDVVRLPTHVVQRTLVSNAALSAALRPLAQRPVEFLTIPVDTGITADAWMMKPPGFDPSKRYPVLFFVYGEPWIPTVVDQYGGKTWLWHLLLAQQGYIVVSVDQRGTASPKGRAWRKAVRGQLGAVRVREQSAAARWVGRLPYVDSTRIGVWGWSGGGSSTLLLMFRAPEVYRMGMAVAPVSDVRNYDTIYQERYTGLPDVDSAAYRDASAIHFVNGLRGDLLIVHGTGDDNVHYQSTEQLINALVAANKPFQLMSYPNRSHGIYEGRGTSRHLYELLTRYLREHLPAGGR